MAGHAGGEAARERKVREGRARARQLGDAAGEAEVRHFDLALAVQQHVARLRDFMRGGRQVTGVGLAGKMREKLTLGSERALTSRCSRLAVCMYFRDLKS